MPTRSADDVFHDWLTFCFAACRNRLVLRGGHHREYQLFARLNGVIDVKRSSRRHEQVGHRAVRDGRIARLQHACARQWSRERLPLSLKQDGGWGNQRSQPGERALYKAIRCHCPPTMWIKSNDNGLRLEACSKCFAERTLKFPVCSIACQYRRQCQGMRKRPSAIVTPMLTGRKQVGLWLPRVS